jgi:hypothetical protein
MKAPSPVCFANHLSPMKNGGEEPEPAKVAALTGLGFLSPTEWGRGAERSEAVRGH